MTYSCNRILSKALHIIYIALVINLLGYMYIYVYIYTAHPPATHEANHGVDRKERNQGDVHGCGRLHLLRHLSGVKAGHLKCNKLSSSCSPRGGIISRAI